MPFFKICHFDGKFHPFLQQLPAPFAPATSGIPAGKPRKNLQYRNLGKVKTSLVCKTTNSSLCSIKEKQSLKQICKLRGQHDIQAQIQDIGFTVYENNFCGLRELGGGGGGGQIKYFECCKSQNHATLHQN